MIKTTIMQVLLARGWCLRSLLLRSMLISTSIHSCWSADGDDCIVLQSRSAYACLRRHCHYGRMSERWPHDRISKLVESNRRQCDLPPYSSTFTFTNSTHSLLNLSLSTSICDTLDSCTVPNTNLTSSSLCIVSWSPAARAADLIKLGRRSCLPSRYSSTHQCPELDMTALTFKRDHPTEVVMN